MSHYYHTLLPLERERDGSSAGEDGQQLYFRTELEKATPVHVAPCFRVTGQKLTRSVCGQLSSTEVTVAVASH